MKRKSKYIKNTIGLSLYDEKKFFGVNTKPYEILVGLNKYVNMSDEYVSSKIGMNLRTYKRHKSYLVMVGSLQVRQLNATTYVYSLGESAIKYDDELHKDSDYLKLAGLVFGELHEMEASYLIDRDKSKKRNIDIIPVFRDEDLFDKAVICSDENPLPNEDEIL